MAAPVAYPFLLQQQQQQNHHQSSHIAHQTQPSLANRPALPRREPSDNLQRILDLERQLKAERMQSGSQTSQPQESRSPSNNRYRSCSSQVPSSPACASTSTSVSPLSTQERRRTVAGTPLSISLPHTYRTPQPHSQSPSVVPGATSSRRRSKRVAPSMPYALDHDSDDSSICQSPSWEGYRRREQSKKEKKYHHNHQSDSEYTSPETAAPQNKQPKPAKLVKPPPSASKTPYLNFEKPSHSVSRTSVSSDTQRQGREKSRRDSTSKPRSRSRSIADRIRSSLDLSRRRERSNTMTSNVSIPVSTAPSEIQIPVTDLSGPEPRIIENPGMCKTYREPNRLTKPDPKKQALATPSVTSSEESRGRRRTQDHEKSKRLSFLGWKRDASRSKHRSSVSSSVPDSAAMASLPSPTSPTSTDFLGALNHPYSPPDLDLKTPKSPKNPRSFISRPNVDSPVMGNFPDTRSKPTNIIPAAPTVTIVAPLDDRIKGANSKMSAPAPAPVPRRGFRDAARAAFRRSISRPPPGDVISDRQEKLKVTSPAHHTVTSLALPTTPASTHSSNTPAAPQPTPPPLPAPRQIKSVETPISVPIPSAIKSATLPSRGSTSRAGITPNGQALRSAISHGNLTVPTPDANAFVIPRKSSRRQKSRPGRIASVTMRDIDSANESDSAGPRTPCDSIISLPNNSRVASSHSPHIQSDVSDSGFGDTSVHGLNHHGSFTADRAEFSDAVEYPPPLRYQKSVVARTSTHLKEPKKLAVSSPYGTLSPYDNESLVESQLDPSETPISSVTSTKDYDTHEPVAMIPKGIEVPAESGIKDLCGSSGAMAKMLVQCCHCKFFHDMPSKVYKCMSSPDSIIKDADLGVSGAIAVGVRCPWCPHSMTTHCCAGYAATVYLTDKFH